MVAVDRRSIFKSLSVSGFVALGSGSVLRQLFEVNSLSIIATSVAVNNSVSALPELPKKLAEIVEEHAAGSDFHEVSAPSKLEQQVAELSADIEAAKTDPHVKDYMQKIRYFEGVFEDDYFITPDEFQLVKDTLARMSRVQRTVGHGNFKLISFDQMVKY